MHDALHQYARHVAEQAHPDWADALADAAAATQRRDQVWQTWRDTHTGLNQQLSNLGSLAEHPDPARLLTDTDTDHTITAGQAQHHTAQQRVAALLKEPALRSLPLGGWC